MIFKLVLWKYGSTIDCHRQTIDCQNSYLKSQNIWAIYSLVKIIFEATIDCLYSTIDCQGIFVSKILPWDSLLEIIFEATIDCHHWTIDCLCVRLSKTYFQTFLKSMNWLLDMFYKRFLFKVKTKILVRNLFHNLRNLLNCVYQICIFQSMTDMFLTYRATIDCLYK